MDEGTNEFRVLDSLAYITGKLLLVEFLVLYQFSTATGRIDCRYGGLITKGGGLKLDRGIFHCSTSPILHT